MTVSVIREGTAEGAARGPPSEGPPPTNIARAVKMYEENKGMSKNIIWNIFFFCPPITKNPTPSLVVAPLLLGNSHFLFSKAM